MGAQPKRLHARAVASWRQIGGTRGSHQEQPQEKRERQVSLEWPEAGSPIRLPDGRGGWFNIGVRWSAVGVAFALYHSSGVLDRLARP